MSKFDRRSTISSRGNTAGTGRSSSKRYQTSSLSTSDSEEEAAHGRGHAEEEENSDDDEEDDSKDALARLQSLLKTKENEIRELRNQASLRHHLPAVVRTVGGECTTAGLSTVTTQSEITPKKELSHGNKMSLSVYITQHLFPQVKFLSKETTIRYPRLVEGCIAHMIPFAKEHDVLSYHSATERFLREQIANRRSYTKKQVRTKFIGKQKATGTSFGGTTKNVCCDN